MSRLKLVLFFIMHQITFGQDLDKSFSVEKDSIISRLSDSYYGAIYKNPDSAKTLARTLFPEYRNQPLVRAWRHHLIGNYFYSRQNADSSLYYFDKVFEDITFSDDPYLFNETKILSGMVYNNTGRPKDALVKLMDAESEINNSPNTKPQLKLNLYRALGIYFLNSSEHERSMDYFLKALKIAEDNESLNNLLDRVLLNLAEVSVVMDDYDMTKQYLIRSRNQAQKNQNEYGVHKANIKLAEVALNTNDVDNYDATQLKNAIAYFEQAKQALNIIEGNLYLARILKKKKQTSLAKQTFEIALETSKKVRMPQGIINASQNLGLIELEAFKPEAAIAYLEGAKELARKYANIQTNIQLNQNLAKAYKASKNYELAVATLETANKLKDSFNKTERFKLAKDLESKYNNEKKEQEISLLTSEKLLLEQQKKSQRNLLLGGIGLTGLVGVFLFVLYRNRKKTTEKLRELDSVKSKFFANISHEFRTPLTLISNPIEEVLEDRSLPDEKREKFTMAKRNSDRLISLVNQLLDLSRIDAKKLKLRIQEGNIGNLIAALSDSFRYAAEQKQITYTVTVQKTMDETYFDKDAVEKIVMNLLSNALKYTPRNGEINCNASATNNTLHFSVKNSGTTLSKEALDNVFQRFYQTSEDNVGSGIGLALVKELVDLHHGSIEVKSDNDQWTTFSIILPIDKNSFKNEHFVEAVHNATGLTQIIDQPNTHGLDKEFVENDQPILLVVEDNQDIRTLLRQNFENQYNILEAENGKTGIDMALEHVPDIIISDIMMPIKDGIALTKELKNNELTSHVPIVLLTAKAGDENELIGIETGADDYVTKPFNTKILTAKVAKLIEIRQKLHDRYSQELVLKPKDIAVSNIDEKFLERVQAVLDEKLVESNFSTNAFSEAVGMSRMQLHRKLKAITGLSASDFIRSQRLKLAAQLLKKSDINVSQIGYSVGFNDHSYFTKRFKETYNCTPTQYAKKHS